MKQWKRLICKLMTFVMVFSLLPVPVVYAEDDGFSCGMELHQHGTEQGCYALTCDLEAVKAGDSITATNDELALHIHGSECYGECICSKEEHFHTEECFPRQDSNTVMEDANEKENIDASAERAVKLEALKTFIDTLPTMAEVQAMSEAEKDGVRAMLDRFYALRDAFQPALEDGELAESYWDKVADAEAGLSPMMMLAAGTHTNHAICGESSCSGHPDGISHSDSVIWTPFPQTDGGPLTAGSYYLDADKTLKATLEIADEVNLCLNGHTLELESGKEGSVILVETDGTLNLCDCSSTDTGIITGGTGRPTPDEYDLDGNIHGGGVWNDGTFNMYSGRISGNTAYWDGGGVYNIGIFTMYGGEISNNQTKKHWGGGVFVEKQSTFIMHDGSISNNDGYTRGGGVYSAGFFTMKDGTISGNYAGDGAGISIDGDEETGGFTMNGGTISGNTAEFYGGGLQNISGITKMVILNDGEIINNHAGQRGGGVFSGMTMYGGTISGNTAGTAAGGIDIYSSCALELHGGTITGNTLSGGTTVSNALVRGSGLINVIEPLAENTKVGISTASVPYTFTTAAVQNGSTIACFVLDNRDYSIKKDTAGKLQVVNGHDHALCGESSCSGHDDGSKHSGSVTWTKLNTTGGNLSAGNYYLSGDITLQTTLVINGNVNLCLNGCTLKLESGKSGSVIKVNSGKTLNLCDCSGTDAGTITGGTIGTKSSQGNGPFGGGIFSFGTLNLYGGSISGNAAEFHGGGVAVISGTFNMYGGRIADNTASVSYSVGGGVYIEDVDTSYVYSATRPKFNMYDGIIENNRANTNGGGIYARRGHVTISGGTISGNTAISDGGGLCVDTYYGGSLNVTGGTFTNNTAGNWGGAIHSSQGSGNTTSDSTIISNATISNNMSGDKYAVWIVQGTNLTVENVTITNNEGSGIVCASKNVTIGKGTVIKGNTGEGGMSSTVGIKVEARNSFTLNGAIIEDNFDLNGNRSNLGYSGADITINSSVASEGSRIGISSSKVPKVISKNTVSDAVAECFFADAPSCAVYKNSSSKLEIAYYHKACGEETCTHAGDAHSTPILYKEFNLTSGGSLSAGNYHLTKDITLSAPLVIDSDVNLCLGGYTLKLADGVSGSVIQISNGKTLNLCDCSGESGTVRYWDKDSDGLWTRKTSGTSDYVTVGGVITGGKSSDLGTGVYNNGGTFNMYGGNITGNTANTYGGGVHNSGSSTFTMYGGRISGNTSKFAGGGVDNCDIFTMYGGEISGNTAKSTGGGVDNFYGIFNMNGGRISGNTASKGGGVSGSGESTFNVAGGSIVENMHSDGTAVSNLYLYSGGLFNESALINIVEPLAEGSSFGISTDSIPYIFAKNATTAATVGCFTSDDPDLFIQQNGDGTLELMGNQDVHRICGAVEECSHAECGDVISYRAINGEDDLIAMAAQGGSGYLQKNIELDKTLNVTSTLNLCLNEYTLSLKEGTGGSVISVASTGKLNICDHSPMDAEKIGSITGGNATQGGGIYNAGELTLFSGVLTDNHATTHGGGVYNVGTFKMYESSIKDNTADGNGAGLYNVGTAMLAAGSISANTSYDGGGGVYTYYDTTLTLGDDISISGNKAKNGGGGIGGYGNITLNGSNISVKKNTLLDEKTPSNILIQKTAFLSANAVGENSMLGISKPADENSPYLFTSDTVSEEQVGYFTSDADNYWVVKNAESKLTLSNFRHTHCLHSEDCTECDAEAQMNWLPIYSDIDLLSLQDGNHYVLTGDMERLEEGIVIPEGATISLCLNGYTIKPMPGVTDQAVISVSKNATLNLCDCTGQGIITGGNNVDTTVAGSTYGGGVEVKIDGIFNMYNGNITGNTASVGAGVSNMGEFNLYDGHIYGNIAKNGMEGGVCNGNIFRMYGGSITDNIGVGILNAGTLLMDGAITVTGNKLDGEDRNVYLRFAEGGQPITLNKLESGSEIGISLEVLPDDVKPTATVPVQIVAGGEAYMAMLKLDGNPDYEIFHKNSNLYAGFGHIHGDCGDISAEQNWHPLKTEADLNNMETGGFYYLAKDITLSKSLTLGANKTVSLCLNNKVLKGSGTGSVIQIAAGAGLNLCDCYSETGTERTWDGYTTKGGVITGGNGTDGGGVDNAGTFHMYSGTIAGNKAKYDGGGVYNDRGEFTLHGGNIIHNNTTGGDGGGVYNNRGEFTMLDGKISGNTAKYDGGGVYNPDGNVIMQGGEISGNTAGEDGGGVYNWDIFTMTGGTVFGNTASNYGGDIHAEAGEDIVTELQGGTLGTAERPAEISGVSDVYLYNKVSAPSGVVKVEIHYYNGSYGKLYLEDGALDNIAVDMMPSNQIPAGKVVAEGFIGDKVHRDITADEADEVTYVSPSVDRNSWLLRLENGDLVLAAKLIFSLETKIDNTPQFVVSDENAYDYELYLKDEKGNFVDLVAGDEAGLYYTGLESGTYSVWYGNKKDAAHKITDVMMSASNVSNSAHFWSVSYDYADDVTASETYYVLQAAVHKIPTAPERENYSFKHWIDGQNSYAAGAEITVSESKAFTAEWRSLIGSPVAITVNPNRHDREEDGVYTENTSEKADGNTGTLYVTLQSRSDSSDDWSDTDHAFKWDSGSNCFTKVLTGNADPESVDVSGLAWNDEKTIITSGTTPVFSGLSPDMEYRLVVERDQYFLTENAAVFGGQSLAAKILYAPELFGMEATLQKQAGLAVEIDTITGNFLFYNSDKDEWQILPEHKDASGGGITVPWSDGKISYDRLWKGTDAEGNFYLYNLMVDRITLSDGTELHFTAGTVRDSGTDTYITYTDEDHGYQAVVLVTGSEQFIEINGDKVYGVYFNKDKNQVMGITSVTIQTAPKMVRLDANGGKINNPDGTNTDTTSASIVLRSDLDGYIPVKENYTFLGWSTEQNSMVAPTFSSLQNDTTLYAQWFADLSDQKTVAVNISGYDTDNSVPFLGADLPKEYELKVQRENENGSWADIQMLKGTIAESDWEGDGADKKASKVTEAFAVPNDNANYRITIGALPKNYMVDGTSVEFKSSDNTIPAVNLLYTSTNTYKQTIKLDTTALNGFGTDALLEKIGIMLMFKAPTGGFEPINQWTDPRDITTADDSLKEDVWVFHTSGAYSVYKVVLENYKLKTEENKTDFDEINAPFTAVITPDEAHADSAADGTYTEDNPFVIKLIPKTYPIRNTKTSQQIGTHTWGFETDLNMLERPNDEEGKPFAGWKISGSSNKIDTFIPADEPAGEVLLTPVYGDSSEPVIPLGGERFIILVDTDGDSVIDASIQVKRHDETAGWYTDDAGKDYIPVDKYGDNRAEVAHFVPQNVLCAGKGIYTPGGAPTPPYYMMQDSTFIELKAKTNATYSTEFGDAYIADQDEDNKPEPQGATEGVFVGTKLSENFIPDQTGNGEAEKESLVKGIFGSGTDLYVVNPAMANPYIKVTSNNKGAYIGTDEAVYIPDRNEDALAEKETTKAGIFSNGTEIYVIYDNGTEGYAYEAVTEGTGIYEGSHANYILDQDGDHVAEPDSVRDTNYRDGIYVGTNGGVRYIPDQTGDGKPEIEVSPGAGIFAATNGNKYKVEYDDADIKYVLLKEADGVYTDGSEAYIPDQNNDGKPEMEINGKPGVFGEEPNGLYVVDLEMNPIYVPVYDNQDGTYTGKVKVNARNYIPDQNQTADHIAEKVKTNAGIFEDGKGGAERYVLDGAVDGKYVAVTDKKDGTYTAESGTRYIADRDIDRYAEKEISITDGKGTVHDKTAIFSGTKADAGVSYYVVDKGRVYTVIRNEETNIFDVKTADAEPENKDRYIPDVSGDGIPEKDDNYRTGIFADSKTVGIGYVPDGSGWFIRVTEQNNGIYTSEANGNYIPDRGGDGVAEHDSDENGFFEDSTGFEAEGTAYISDGSGSFRKVTKGEDGGYVDARGNYYIPFENKVLDVEKVGDSYTDGSFYYIPDGNGGFTKVNGFVLTVNTTVDGKAASIDDNGYGYTLYAVSSDGSKTAELAGSGNSYTVMLQPGIYDVYYGDQEDAAYLLKTVNVTAKTDPVSQNFYSITFQNGDTEVERYIALEGMEHAITAENLTPAAGSFFDGWKNSRDEKQYRLGDSFTVSGKTIMSALWAGSVTVSVDVKLDHNAYDMSGSRTEGYDYANGAYLNVALLSSIDGDTWTEEKSVTLSQGKIVSGKDEIAGTFTYSEPNLADGASAEERMSAYTGIKFTGLNAALQYKLVVNKEAYIEVSPVKQTKDDATIHMEAEICYSPGTFTLYASMHASDKLKAVLTGADVRYQYLDNGVWLDLTQHSQNGLAAIFDAWGMASVREEVWRFEDESDKANSAYDYSARVASAVIDGKTFTFDAVPVIEDGIAFYRSDDHGYQAEVSVADGRVKGGRDTVYFAYNAENTYDEGEVKGRLNIDITDGNRKTITLDALDGVFEDGKSTKTVSIVTVDDLKQYVPKKDESNFDGNWYNASGEKITAYNQLTNNQTIFARWNDDNVILPVTVVVDGFYDPAGGENYQNIPDADLPTEVVLEVNRSNGDYVTVVTAPILEWKKNAAGNLQATASADVKVPNEADETYQLKLITPDNYVFEKEVAFKGTDQTIQAHLEFAANMYHQSLQLVTDAIQNDLIEKATVVVTFKDDLGNFNPIEQAGPLEFNAETTSNAVDVWVHRTNGSSASYAAYLKAYNDINYVAEDAPFAVTVSPSEAQAKYANGKYVETEPIKVTLKPKMYPITTDEGITGTHTWSIDTVLADALAIPEIAAGKVFAGWKMKDDTTDKIFIVISAETAEAIELEAVWMNTTDTPVIETGDTEYPYIIFVDENGDGKDIVGVPVKEKCADGTYKDAEGKVYIPVTMIENQTKHFIPNGVLKDTNVAGIYAPNKLNQPIYMSVDGPMFNEVTKNTDNSYTDPAGDIFIPYNRTLLPVEKNNAPDDGSYVNDAAAPTEYYIPYEGDFVKVNPNADGTYRDSEGYTYRAESYGKFVRITAALHTILTKLNGTPNDFGYDFYAKDAEGNHIALYETSDGSGIYEVRLPAGEYDIYYMDAGEEIIAKESITFLNNSKTVEINWFTVTYNPDNGSLPIEETVLEGADYEVAISVPTKDGYFFRGWRYNNETTLLYQAEGTFKVTEEATLTAQWAKKISVDISLTIDTQAYDASGDKVSGESDADYADREFVVTLQQKAKGSSDAWTDTGMAITLADGKATSTSDGVLTTDISCETDGDVYTYSGTAVFTELALDMDYQLNVKQAGYKVNSSSYNENENKLVAEIRYVSGLVTVKTTLEYVQYGKGVAPSAVNVMYQRYDESAKVWEDLDYPESGTFDKAEVTHNVWESDYTRVRIESIVVDGETLIFDAEPEAIKDAGKTAVYTSNSHGYKAEVTVKEGELSPDGILCAVYNDNDAAISVVINNTGMKNVTLDANNGTFANGGKTQEAYLLKYSDLEAYQPEREDYTFTGWADEAGTAQITSYADIPNDGTIYAQWSNKYTNIPVIITMDGFYTVGSNTLDMSTSDRPVQVSLNVLDDSGKLITTALKDIPPKAWEATAGSEPYKYRAAVATTASSNVYKYKATVEVSVSVPNIPGMKYHFELGDGMNGYEIDNDGFGVDDSNTTVSMSFAPRTYQQAIEFDAKAIQNGMLKEAVIAINFMDRQGNYNDPIVQLDAFTFSDTAETVTATADVWVFRTDGKMSSYKPEIKSYTLKNDTSQFALREAETEVPFVITYDPENGVGAVRVSGDTYEQAAPLKVTLTPKEYEITTHYGLRTTYKWSVGVEDIAALLTEPVEKGKIFLGWEKEGEPGTFVRSISPETYGDIKLVEVWKELRENEDPVAYIDPYGYKLLADHDGDGTDTEYIIVSTDEGNGTYSDTATGKLYYPVTMLNGDRHFVPKDVLLDKDNDGIYIPNGLDAPIYMLTDAPRFKELKDNGDGTYTDGEINYIPDQDGDGKLEPDKDGDGAYEGTRDTQSYIPIENENGEIEYVPVEPLDNPPGAYKPVTPDAENPEEILIPDINNPGKFIPVVPDADHPGAYKDSENGQIYIPVKGDDGETEYVPVEPTDNPPNGYKDGEGDAYIPVVPDGSTTPEFIPVNPLPGGGINPSTGQEYIYVDTDGDKKPDAYIPATPNGDGTYKDPTGKKYKPVDENGDGSPEYYIPVNTGGGSSSGSGGGGGGTSSSSNVTVNKTENGKVTINNAKAGKGDVVIITVIPDAGYELDTLKVVDRYGKEIKVNELGNNKYSFVSPGGKVVVNATYRLIESEITLENYVAAKAMILKVNARYAMIFGDRVLLDAPVVIRNERAMLPIRVIAENLGADVEWDGFERKVTITKEESVIEIFVDSSVAKVNGKDVMLDAAAFIENDRTYLPLRFVAENLDATVLWDAKEKQIIIVPNIKEKTFKITEDAIKQQELKEN